MNIYHHVYNHMQYIMSHSWLTNLASAKSQQAWVLWLMLWLSSGLALATTKIRDCWVIVFLLLIQFVPCVITQSLETAHQSSAASKWSFAYISQALQWNAPYTTPATHHSSQQSSWRFGHRMLLCVSNNPFICLKASHKRCPHCWWLPTQYLAMHSSQAQVTSEEPV